MFNPNNLDEMCVQSTHIELNGKKTTDKFSKNPFNLGGNKFKGNKFSIMNKGGDKPTCMNSQKKWS